MAGLDSAQNKLDSLPDIETKKTIKFDLKNPPGFAGELTRWINSQCRYPRENLAVAAALQTIGNVAGLRYIDGYDGITPNLFTFCVAESSTGKEQVMQAQHELHRAAGIHLATHGSIKSEQEIIRNLIRHQAAFYIIDEIGILLSKIENARKKGGAIYLDGVIGQLMSAYSKASGFMLLTGDMKEEIRKVYLQEIKTSKDDSDYIQKLEAALEQIDNGLQNPYLSLIGFTTPATFNHVCTYEQAANGFIGRSLLIREHDTNPRIKKGFRKEPLPNNIANRLINMRYGGWYDSTNTRVEHYGDKIEIKTTPEGIERLNQISDWIFDEAEMHKARTGQEAVIRRGYELIGKISTIMAIPEGIRKIEHIEWAFALVQRDLEEKTTLVHANEHEKTDPDTVLRIKILKQLSETHGETASVIYSRVKSKTVDRAKVEAVLEYLCTADILKKVEDNNNYHKKGAERYFLA